MATKKIEPVYSVETMAKAIDESIDREHKETKESLRSWLVVYYQCMNEALDKIEKGTDDAWEDALAVLRRSENTQNAIIGIIERVGSPRQKSFEGELSRAQIEFERELVTRINALRKVV